MWGIIAVAAVSALMQAYQSEKARGATNSRLKEIEKMFDAIVPPDFDLKVYDDPALAKDLPGPELNVEAITPEAFELAGTYNPEVADFVREQAPELVRASEAAQTGRGAQLDALERYREIASGGFDPELAQKLDEASRRAQTDAQSRSASIVQDANRRGVMGSGLEFAAKQRASSDAMSRAADDSRFAAAESYRNQLMAMDKSANLGGDIRSSEMAEEARNVGIINDFNERASRNYQDYLTAKTETANKAKLINLEREQQVSDANTSARNLAAVQNRQRYNDAQQTKYNVAKDNRNTKLDVLDRKQRLKQQMYENLMTKARGKAGIAQTGIDYLRSDTRDRNQAIQGVGDAAIAGMLYSGKYNQNAQPETKYPTPSSMTSSNDYSGKYVYPGEDDREGNYL